MPPVGHNGPPLEARDDGRPLGKGRRALGFQHVLQAPPELLNERKALLRRLGEDLREEAAGLAATLEDVQPHRGGPGTLELQGVFPADDAFAPLLAPVAAARCGCRPGRQDVEDITWRLLELGLGLPLLQLVQLRDLLRRGQPDRGHHLVVEVADGALHCCLDDAAALSWHWQHLESPNQLFYRDRGTLSLSQNCKNKVVAKPIHPDSSVPQISQYLPLTD